MYRHLIPGSLLLFILICVATEQNRLAAQSVGSCYDPATGKVVQAFGDPDTRCYGGVRCVRAQKGGCWIETFQCPNNACNGGVCTRLVALNPLNFGTGCGAPTDSAKGDRCGSCKNVANGRIICSDIAVVQMPDEMGKCTDVRCYGLVTATSASACFIGYGTGK